MAMTVGDVRKFLENVPDAAPFNLALTEDSAEQIIEDGEVAVLSPVGMVVEDLPPNVGGGKLVIMSCDLDFDDNAEYNFDDEEELD